MPKYMNMMTDYSIKKNHLLRIDRYQVNRNKEGIETITFDVNVYFQTFPDPSDTTKVKNTFIKRIGHHPLVIDLKSPDNPLKQAYLSMQAMELYNTATDPEKYK